MLEQFITRRTTAHGRDPRWLEKFVKDSPLQEGHHTVAGEYCEELPPEEEAETEATE